MPLKDKNAIIDQHKEAEPSKQPPRQSAGHKRLNAFVGTWNIEGRQHEGPVGPSAKITAVETFEWLTGQFFLVHRFEGRVDDGESACIEIIGHDAESQSYPTHTFYNNGITNEWQSHERDGTWILTGAWQMAGKRIEVRCTTVFGDDGNTRTGRWEHASDGSNWDTFWNVKATKAK